MSELLPCPFDGAMAVVELCSPFVYGAGCCECAAVTYGSSREEAVAAWNRRANRPPAFVSWLQSWWTNDEAWRAQQRKEYGPDVAHLLRGVADMIEGLPVVLGTEKGLTPAGQHIADCERDAKRWQLVPAFLEKYQIDYVGLLRDIDTARAKGERNG